MRGQASNSSESDIKENTGKRTEEDRQSSGLPYRSLFENNIDAVLLTAPDGRILAVNPAACRMFGMTEVEICKLGQSGLADAADPRFPDALEEVRRTGMYPGELTFLRKDGSKFTGAVFSVSFQDPEGQALTGTIIRDAAGHKQAEESIAPQFAEISSYYGSMQTGFAVLDLELRYLRINNKFAEINGLPAAAHIGKTYGEFFPNMQDQATRVTTEILRTGKSSSGSEFQGETSAQPGIVHTWLESWHPLRNSIQNIVGFLVAVQDISERKRLEEALRDSEAEYRLMIENQTDLVVKLDPDGRFLYVNPAYCAMLGKKEDELLGQSFLSFLHEENRDSIVESMNVLHKPPFTAYLEHRAASIHGWRWLAWACTAVLDDAGNVIGIVGVGRDLTERKGSEKELQDRNKDLAALNTYARHLAETLDESKVVENVTRACVENFGAQLAWLTRANLDQSLGMLGYFPTVSNETAQAIHRLAKGSFAEVPDGRAILSRKPVVQTDVDDYSDYIPWQELMKAVGVVASAAFPLISRGVPIGALSLFSDRADFFTPQKIEFFEMFANQAAIALENAHLYSSVKTGRDELRQMTSRLAAAEETERQKLARELHDRVGQNLSAINITLNIVRSKMSAEQAAAIMPHLDDSIELVDETVERIRDVLAELRPEVLDDYGLPAALHWYSDRFSRRTGIRIEINTTNVEMKRPPAAIETVLFRIAQEALTNVSKHANAGSIILTLDMDGAKTRLVICDDGIGFDPSVAQNGWGLRIIRERAESIGGRVQVKSVPGHGTQVIVEA